MNTFKYKLVKKSPEKKPFFQKTRRMLRKSHPEPFSSSYQKLNQKDFFLDLLQLGETIRIETEEIEISMPVVGKNLLCLCASKSLSSENSDGIQPLPLVGLKTPYIGAVFPDPKPKKLGSISRDLKTNFSAFSRTVL